ncbi:MAG: PAS domain S-box protein [Methylococcales bacterium]|nr:MAG: PAS domain S-box protein [Methylococcales bacterium]
MLYKLTGHRNSKRLHNTFQKLSRSFDNYIQCYNSSPIAYLTLNEQGVIKQANPSATHLLTGSNEVLLDEKLETFIHSSDQDDYHFFIKDLLDNKNDSIVTVKLVNRGIEYRQPECSGFRLIDCSRSLCKHQNPLLYIVLRGVVNRNIKNGVEFYLSIQNVSESLRNQEIITCLNQKLEEKVFQQNAKLVQNNLDLTKKITELTQSKKQLAEREAKLNSIFDASMEGIVTFAQSGLIVSTNMAVETYFGYSQQELLNRPFNILIASLQINKPFQTLIHQLITKDPTVLINQIYEVNGIRKDGSTLPLEVSIVKYSIDGALYFTGILRDISLRKQQEQKEQTHLTELAHVARLCLIDEMGSGIAHEINQPLTAIANYSQACLRLMHVEKPDFTQLSDILLKIHQQSLSLGQIIHRIKNLVSYQAAIRTNTNINMLIQEVVSLCMLDFNRNNIHICLNLLEDMPEIMIDNVQIEQVLLHLIRNSIDALKNSKNQRQLLIQSCIRNLNQVEVSVQDNGSGVDEGEKNTILNTFFTTKIMGLGLGLSISKSIVESHQGILDFTSKTNEGTTFYFLLPIKTVSHVSR